MKRAVLLYNPKSGNRSILNHLDYIFYRMQKIGYTVEVYRSNQPGAIEAYIKKELQEKEVDLILISGGDGTLNTCINGMAKRGISIPVGILPLGTANDFAHAAQIPEDIRGALDVIEYGKRTFVDVGKVNDQYFVNVCNMGLFSCVSHEVDIDLKKKYGKLAYYAKGIEEVQNYRPMRLRITTEEKVVENEYALILIFNGKGAGGFMRIAKEADIQDGKFNFVGIKAVELYEIPLVFIKTIQGEYITDKVDVIEASHLCIEKLEENLEIETDIDGEKGPDLPLEIHVVSNLLEIYLPK